MEATVRVRLIRPRELPPPTEGYFWLDNSVAQDPAISFDAWCAYMVLEYLAQHGQSEPALSTVAATMRAGKARARRALTELQAAGLVALPEEVGAA